MAPLEVVAPPLDDIWVYAKIAETLITSIKQKTKTLDRVDTATLCVFTMCLSSPQNIAPVEEEWRNP
jgi:hypothetical protein